MKHRTETEYFKIANNMIKFGGSFFANLGKALKYADATNSQKLANTFARDFARYEQF